MIKNLSANTTISLSKDGIFIDDEAKIILCASLFYFRIPRELWRDRMEKIKAAGYHAIDVYFPWNYHSLYREQWEFDGNKDIESFLQLAAELELYVVARPGPYICSEWDGGGLPAWLFIEEGLRLRDNCPQFLGHVATWFEQIMPIMAKYELGREGTVICVQLDNELDFYDCQDPEGYMEQLRDMALSHHISVPLIACAGQGDLYRASGFVDDVIPTCNFYPDDLDPNFESLARHYTAQLMEKDLPLMVTETNRSHFLLRRLLSIGTKLLGPYLQASGTDFGFTNSVNNWGDPYALLTSDYDFSGMISPEGHIRDEAEEGAILRSVINTYGQALALATPDYTQPFKVLDEQTVRAHALKLEGGGYLLSIPNVQINEIVIYIESEKEVFPRKTPIMIKPQACPLLPFDVPMHLWGINGRLRYASAELYKQEKIQGVPVLSFHGSADVEICLMLEEEVEIKGCESSINDATGDITLYFPKQQRSKASIYNHSGLVAEIMVMPLDEAKHLEPITKTPDLDQTTAPPISQWSIAPATVWSEGLKSRHIEGDLQHLEYYGVYRGFTWYETSVPKAVQRETIGWLLHDTADLVSVYADDRYEGTYAPAGGSLYLPAPRTELTKMALRLEIWGHSNFDDARLPALSLKSLKGITGLTFVNKIKSIQSYWKCKPLALNENYEPYMGLNVNDDDWTFTQWGGWFSAGKDSICCYRQTILPSEDADSWTLQMQQLEGEVVVYVNGDYAGKLDALHPFVDISAYVQAGQQATIACLLKRRFSESAGEISLLEGVKANSWKLVSAEERAMWQLAMSTNSESQKFSWPLSLKPGETRWLYGSIDGSYEGNGWRVFCKGQHMKLTIFFNGIVIGRLWLGDSEHKPIFTGGHQHSFYLPGPWVGQGDNQLAILLEAVQSDDVATLEPLTVAPVL